MKTVKKLGQIFLALINSLGILLIIIAVAVAIIAIKPTTDKTNDINTELVTNSPFDSLTIHHYEKYDIYEVSLKKEESKETIASLLLNIYSSNPNSYEFIIHNGPTIIMSAKISPEGIVYLS